MVFSLAIVWLRSPFEKKFPKRHFQNSVTFLCHCWFFRCSTFAQFSVPHPIFSTMITWSLESDRESRLIWKNVLVLLTLLLCLSKILSNILRLTLGILFELMPDRDLGMKDHSWHPWRVVPLEQLSVSITLTLIIRRDIQFVRSISAIYHH